MLLVKVFNYGIRCNKLLTQCYIVSSCPALPSYNATKKLFMMFLYNKYKSKGLCSAVEYQWYAKPDHVFCLPLALLPQEETLETLEGGSEGMAWFIWWGMAPSLDVSGTKMSYADDCKRALVSLHIPPSQACLHSLLPILDLHYTFVVGSFRIYFTNKTRRCSTVGGLERL